jgi:hypothetical protein
MPEEQEKEQAETISHYTNVRAADFRSIYSNNAAFAATLFDFSMIFGEVMGVEQISETEGTVTVEQKVKITMTPLQAKVFVQVAARHISAYEDKFGPIQVPSQFLATVPFKGDQAATSDEPAK